MKFLKLFTLIAAISATLNAATTPVPTPIAAAAPISTPTPTAAPAPATTSANTIFSVAGSKGCAQFVKAVTDSGLQDTASDASAAYWAFVFKDATTPLPTGKDLKNLIANHVVPVKPDVKKTTTLTPGQLETVKGKKLTVVDATHIKGNTVTATIVDTQACDNGVVFIIDKPLDEPAS